MRERLTRKMTRLGIGILGLWMVSAWAAGPVWAQAPEETAGASRIQSIRAEAENGQVTIHVDGTGALQYTAFKLTEPLRLVLDFQNMTASPLSEPIEVNQGVVGRIRPMYFDEARVQRLEIDLTATAAYEIQKPQPNRLLITLKGSGPRVTQVPLDSPKPAPASSPEPAAETEALREVSVSATDLCDQFLGDKTMEVTVEFRDASLINIFRFMAEVGGVNLIVSPDINVNADLNIKQSPWNKVFRVLLANHDLGMSCTNGIIRVTPTADLRTERFMQPVITQLVRLNYADPTMVLANLDPLKSVPDGKVVADVRTNSVIITDTERVVSDMMEVIRNLDRPTRQVQIESKIVEMNRNFTQELGIQWGFSGTTFRNPQFPAAIQFSGAGQTGGGVNFGTATSPFGATPAQGTVLANPRIDPGFIVDLATVNPAVGAIATSLRSLSGDLTLDLQLSALEAQGKSRVITSPTVTALDNKEATIRSGTRLPYQTTDPSSGTEIQFIDAVIELRVTPHITADNTIYLVVNASQNAPNNRLVQGLPGIDTREATAELLVANGDTAILGGLFQKSVTDNNRQVPYVGEIPILGNLFKSHLEIDNVNELLIFIKPTLVGNM